MKNKRLITLSVLLATSAFAGIDSGGGKTTIGSLQNHGSIGAITTTGAQQVDYLVNRNGLIEVLYAVPMTTALDSDGDNIPDAWETSNGLIVGIDDSGIDGDGDSATNLMEYLAGTDPQLFESVYNPSVDITGGVYQVSMPTVNGRNYRLYVSVDMENWEVWQNIAGNGSVATYTFDTASAAALNLFPAEAMQSCMFRVGLTLDP